MKIYLIFFTEFFLQGKWFSLNVHYLFKIRCMIGKLKALPFQGLTYLLEYGEFTISFPRILLLHVKDRHFETRRWRSDVGK